MWKMQLYVYLRRYTLAYTNIHEYIWEYTQCEHMRTYVHIDKYAHKNVCRNIRNTYISTYSHTYKQTQTWSNIQTCGLTCTHWTYTCAYIHLFTYIHIQAYTYTHIDITPNTHIYKQMYTSKHVHTYTF